MSEQRWIAHYRIVAKLGEGGMGEVWRATDTRLSRDVAIKLLPPAISGDGQYMARFEREAQTLAALNHPNIAAIYGIEQGAIIMELVEGETLPCPVPLPTALEYARQIADGLEAAHEKNIIHRDLKPVNVKVTTEGVVKLLDFGLAKAVEKAQASSASSADTPTATMGATQAGLIVGTPAYMSPEQAAGKSLDRRTDIWSFGVVLYELLTGERLFEGETVSHTLAAVLHREIDLADLPAETPPAIRGLLRRCLDRNIRTRLSCITEARVAIDSVGDKTVAAPESKRSPWPWITVAAASVLMLAAVSFVHFIAEGTDGPPIRSFSFTPKDLPDDRFNRRASISPDGRQIVYVAERKLWVRPLDSEQARSIDGSEGADGPFWSPDSAQIGFASGGELKKVSLSGGIPFIVAKFGGGFRGGAWSPDGRTFLISTLGEGLWEVPVGGGDRKVVAPVSPRAVYYSPSYLPIAGKRRLAVAGKGNRISQNLELVDLDTGMSETLRAPGAFPAWSAAGYILHQSDARTPGLWALRFSSSAGKAEGEPVSLRSEGSDVSSSADGTLLWIDAVAGESRRLIWRNRNGSKSEDAGIPSSADITMVALSPDGTRAAYQSTEQANPDLWVANLARRLRTRLTFTPEIEGYPVWLPSGSEIAFAWQRKGSFEVFAQAANGSGAPRPLLVSRDHNYPCALTPDGATLLFLRRAEKTGFDLWTAKRKADGTFDAPAVWLQTPFDESSAVFSPDGNYVAYQSDESGRIEVYVRPSRAVGAKWPVSTNGGRHPRWSHDGREIFYAENDRLMAAPVNVAAGVLRFGTPVELFRNPAFADTIDRRWDAHPDGKRFLVAEASDTGVRPISIHVILNWSALLREKRLR
jgi:serine/threonine-protein kinase